MLRRAPVWSNTLLSVLKSEIILSKKSYTLITLGPTNYAANRGQESLNNMNRKMGVRKDGSSSEFESPENPGQGTTDDLQGR